METLGVFLFIAGAWATYCGYEGINPITTGFQILTHANQAEKVLTDANTAAAARLASVSAAASQGATETAAGTTPTVPGDAGTVVAFARAQLGKPYVHNGSGPDGWDCSGLVQAAYAKVGVKLLHSASAQMLRGTRIYRKADLQAGDLLFPAHVLGVASLGDHVQIATESGTLIEAPQPGENVREVPLSKWWPGSGVYAKRLLAAPAQNTAGNYYGSGKTATGKKTVAGNTAGSYYG